MAIIEGSEHYHRSTDNFENLNRNSAYHYLTITLGLADYVANNSLLGMDIHEEAVFFPFLPNNMILLTYSWAYILFIFSIALATAFLFYEAKYKRLNIYSTLCVLALIMFSIFSAIFFHAGSYLFWIPLLTTTIPKFLKKWLVAYYITKIISRISTIILWIPLIYVPFVLGFSRISNYLFIIFLVIYFALYGIERYEIKQES